MVLPCNVLNMLDKNSDFSKANIENFGAIDTRLLCKNGNGVYLTEGKQIIIVFDNGFRTDYITVYNDQKWAGDSYHSKTTCNAVNSLIKKYNL